MKIAGITQGIRTDRRGPQRNKKSRLVIILALSGVLVFSPFRNLGAVPVPSQTSCPESRLNKDFFLKWAQDFQQVLTSPEEWNGKDIITLTAVVSAGALLGVFDRDVYEQVQDWRNASSIKASSYISKFGNGAYLGGFMAVLYASGELFHDEGLRKTSLLCLESFVTTSVVVLSLKFFSGRARPYAEEGPYRFRPFSLKSRYLSFPSADAASAFAVATTIAERSPRFYVDVLAYSLAGLVALYRVHDRKHWPSDVFFGSALGYFIARKISCLNPTQEPEGLHVSFQLTPQGQAVTLSFVF
ncbi:MAG: phosphatase PAP2 family protein [Candidatus Aminicenantales bacterium]